MAQPVVGIVGMRALRRDIKRQTDDKGSALFAAMREAGREAAGPVAEATRSRLPQVSGRLAGDVRVTATRTGAGVRMGRSNLRYAGWVEFGGTRKAPHQSTRQFLRQGRYLFPAARTLAGPSLRLYTEALEKVFGTSKIWTNTTTNPGMVHD